MSVSKKLYADLNGVKVHNFTLENKNGMKAEIIEKLEQFLKPEIKEIQELKFNIKREKDETR